MHCSVILTRILITIILGITKCSSFTREKKHLDHLFSIVVQIIWNELDQSVKNVDSLPLFKSKLKKKTTPHNPYHDLGCRKISCILASIRMKCSKLNHDLSVNDIIENDLCNCGNIETAFHFFLECPLYTMFRNRNYVFTKSIIEHYLKW